MRRLKVLLVLPLLLLYCQNFFAQIPLSDKAEITLLTCGPGEELYSVFGHTAIRIYDKESNIDAVYNFGTFDFDTPNFYLKFVKGDLKYFVSVSSYEEFIYQYVYYNRDVYEQVLDISQRQKQNIYNELNSTLLSEKRYYTYKFIDRNCTTMVADILSRNIPGKISEETSDKGKTNREIIHSYLDNMFFENLGINLMFGYKTDKVSDKLFLPQELLEGVDNTKIKGERLALPPVHVYKAKEKESNKPFWNNYYFFSAIMLALMFFTRSKTVLRSYLALTGLLGLFFCFVGFYSYHTEITQNYNALLINPLFLLLLYFTIAGKKNTIVITLYICIGLLILYLIFTFNKPHFVMILPIAATNIIIFIRILMQVKLKQNTITNP
ncbi:DUF4105 domain-containing protein [Flavobacterium sp. MK4S-17]|uniref:Lnb N-terminal periplasmic domain-containing protein n=1 Tax=Flavobacterium sp. MK4S-17 TaxID=2543737 RepID=UPI001359BBE5|nr:DUF4105 domain-containing protein [Flavobacterium sp. MK4S-17]